MHLIPARALTVLYEDNHLLVVDKPAGLLTQSAVAGDDNLLDRGKAWLRARYDKPGNVFLGLVQRLDRNVGGVVVLARTSKAAARLTAAFKGREVDKRYLAVVVGEAPLRAELVHELAVGDDGGAYHAPGVGKHAALRYERIAAARGASALLVTLLTGRKHQARVQLALAGLPLIGDPRYGAPDASFRRPALHAWRLAITHPVQRTPMTFTAPIPADLRALLQRRGLDGSVSELEAKSVC